MDKNSERWKEHGAAALVSMWQRLMLPFQKCSSSPYSDAIENQWILSPKFLPYGKKMPKGESIAAIYLVGFPTGIENNMAPLKCK